MLQPITSFPQAVVDNENTMKDSIERLDRRAADIADALDQAETEAARMRIEKFVWYVSPVLCNRPLNF